ncbi:hypothetical protein [Actinomadura sp. 7K534]|uniref:hypothetical protein n=1 Tax=Actinomadura sp. 7K534 TaxID=2530366 RepID=UPI00104BE8E1|nr:hypothetical protein [Actinomadura sp. 7K534]TDB88249.1 hypothetical protein E1266_31555 [Actinomadura sp. 7K534]
MRGRAGIAVLATLTLTANTLMAVQGASSAVAETTPTDGASRPYEVTSKRVKEPFAVAPRRMVVPLTWSESAVEPVGRAITYRNNTRKDQEIRLRVKLRDRSGNAAPAALAALSADSLTVPAGREAGAKLELRRHGVKPGAYRGTVQVTSATGEPLGATALSIHLRAPVPAPAPPVGSVTASPDSITVDLASPGIPDLTRRHTITYRNTGPRPVTLRLAADLTGPDEEPTEAPAELLEAPDQVTVPRRGSAEVTLTFRGAGIPHGRYQGTLVATGTDGAAKVTTPLAVDVGREKYNVAVNLVDRNGVDPTQPTWVYAWSVTDGGRWERRVENGTGVFELPPGVYDVTTAIATGEGETLINHRITVDDWDLDLVMDAREGEPVELSPQGVDVPGMIEAWYETPWYRFTAEGPEGSVFAVWHGPGEVTENVGFQALGWGKRDATEGPGAAYILSRYFAGRIPSDTVWHPSPDELSVTRNHFRSVNHSRSGGLNLTGGYVDSLRMDVTFPQTVTTYIEPGLTYSRELGYGIAYENWAQIADYQAVAEQGERDDVWNGAVLTPGDFGVGAKPRRSSGGQLSVIAPITYVDSSGRTGSIDRTTNEFTLAADGQTIATGTGQLYASLAPESKRYTLTWDRTANPEIAVFSTATKTEWSFESHHIEWEEQILPLHLLRLAVPGLSDDNAAAPGSESRIPVKVRPVEGLPTPEITSMSVETSADDGGTWQAAPSAEEDGTWIATVTNPDAPGFVSLRITATDADGNTVTQTVVRAYKVES